MASWRAPVAAQLPPGAIVQIGTKVMFAHQHDAVSYAADTRGNDVPRAQRGQPNFCGVQLLFIPAETASGDGPLACNAVVAEQSRPRTLLLVRSDVASPSYPGGRPELEDSLSASSAAASGGEQSDPWRRCAARELREELGIALAPSDLTHVLSTVTRGRLSHHFVACTHSRERFDQWCDTAAEHAKAHAQASEIARLETLGVINLPLYWHKQSSRDARHCGLPAQAGVLHQCLPELLLCLRRLGVLPRDDVLRPLWDACRLGARRTGDVHNLTFQPLAQCDEADMAMLHITSV